MSAGSLLSIVRTFCTQRERESPIMSSVWKHWWEISIHKVWRLNSNKKQTLIDVMLRSCPRQRVVWWKKQRFTSQDIWMSNRKRFCLHYIRYKFTISM
uniref:Candidate secreted effector n=1 Tax=Meloidogyne incognita TaxID=6306 RepID=A0A914N0W0_MELIC